MGSTAVHSTAFLRLDLKNNWYSLAAFALGTVLLALILFVPALYGLFAVQPLTAQEVWLIVILAVIPTILIQLVKVIRENRD